MQTLPPEIKILILQQALDTSSSLSILTSLKRNALVCREFYLIHKKRNFWRGILSHNSLILPFFTYQKIPFVEAEENEEKQLFTCSWKRYLIKEGMGILDNNYNLIKKINSAFITNEYLLVKDEGSVIYKDRFSEDAVIYRSKNVVINSILISSIGLIAVINYTYFLVKNGNLIKLEVPSNTNHKCDWHGLGVGEDNKSYVPWEDLKRVITVEEHGYIMYRNNILHTGTQYMVHCTDALSSFTVYDSVTRKKLYKRTGGGLEIIVCWPFVAWGKEIYHIESGELCFQSEKEIICVTAKDDNLGFILHV